VVSPVLRGISCSDYRATLAGLEEAGWSISKTNGGHLKFQHPKASKAIFGPCSPSDHRSRLNVIRKCNIAIEEAAREVKVFGPAPTQEKLSDGDFTAILKRKKKMRKSSKHRHIPASHYLSDPAVVEVAQPIATKRKFGTLVLAAGTHGAKAVAEISATPIKDIAKKMNDGVTSAQPRSTPNEVKDNDKMLDTVSTPKALTPAPVPAIPQAPVQTPIPTSQPTPTTPDPLTAQPECESNRGIPSISVDVLALAVKIASGSMKQVTVTADMVGQTLYYDGEIALAGAVSAPVQPAAAQPKVMTEKVAMTAISTTSAAIAPLASRDEVENVILEGLKVGGPDFITIKDLVGLTLLDLPYKDFRSARASLPRYLERLVKKGTLTVGKIGISKAYRIAD
jgi:hypothetical protein